MTDTKKQNAPTIEKLAHEKPADDQETPGPVAEENEPEEYGGPKGLEPTRYGDWERKGMISDF
jgi:hypothetical protein